MSIKSKNKTIIDPMENTYRHMSPPAIVIKETNTELLPAVNDSKILKWKKGN